MKKLVSTLAIVAFMLTMSANASTGEPKQKKKKAKTEKSCSTEEKKSCGTKEAKGGCCAGKKVAENKS